MELGAHANKFNTIVYNSIRGPLWNMIPLSYKYMGCGIGVSNNNLVARTQLSVYELVKGTKNKNMEIGNSVSDSVKISVSETIRYSINVGPINLQKRPHLENADQEIALFLSDLIRNTWGHIIYDCLIKTEYHAIR